MVICIDVVHTNITVDYTIVPYITLLLYNPGQTRRSPIDERRSDNEKNVLGYCCKTGLGESSDMTNCHV